MDFALTREQQRLCDEIREFAVQNLGKDLFERDKKGAVGDERWRDDWEACAETGLLGALMPKVYHDVASRALQLHGSLGASNEMPFAEQVIDSFHMGLADGPTEVHKVTVARQVLRDYAPSDDLFPTRHIPKLREQALTKLGEAFEHEQVVAHDADDLVVVDDRSVADAEALEQPGTIADIHLGSHGYDRLGHGESFPELVLNSEHGLLRSAEYTEADMGAGNAVP